MASMSLRQAVASISYVLFQTCRCRPEGARARRPRGESHTPSTHPAPLLFKVYIQDASRAGPDAPCHTPDSLGFPISPADRHPHCPSCLVQQLTSSVASERGNNRSPDPCASVRFGCQTSALDLTYQPQQPRATNLSTCPSCQPHSKTLSRQSSCTRPSDSCVPLGI